MSRGWWWIAGGLVLGMACDAEPPHLEPDFHPDTAAETVPAPDPEPAAPAQAAADPAPDPTPAADPHAIAWQGPIEWRTWDEGLAEARREGKPLCLLVYADWCPHCRALAPVFARPDVVTLARRMVMVRQDGDAHPAWLTERVGRFGTYVPRIFFFGSDGRVRPDITSGNARYPYFYTPEGVDRLRASMKAALGG